VGCPNGCQYGPAVLCGTERLHLRGEYPPEAKVACQCDCHNRVVGYWDDHRPICLECAESMMGPLVTDPPILREDASGLKCLECGAEL